MTHTRYSPEQLAFLKRQYQVHDTNALTDLFNETYGTDKQVSHIRACLKNHKITCGRTGRFEKGQAVWNKGMTGRPVHANSKATQFKKGCKPANQKPLGHERICSKDDCVLVKVAEKNPYTNAPTRYRYKHQVLWEQHNGPIPHGHVVIFKDGNKRNFALDNLELVNRKVLLRMNKHHYRDQDQDVKPALLSLSKLEVAIFDKQK